jgi:hypothetical protein
MKLLLVVIAALAAFAAAKVAAERRKLRQSAGALGLDAPGVRVIDCENLAIRFAVKPEEGSVYVIHDIDAPPRRIPLEDLAGCELLDFGERKRSLGRVLAGEAAADHLSGHAPLAVLRILRRGPEPDPIEYRLTKPTYYEDFRIFAKKVSALVEEYTE